jgi:heme-degrading monooxygenase HmoA
LLPELRRLPGFSGAYLLARDDDGLIELTAHTLWESQDAIRAFAGDDITTAVVEPEALAVLEHSDATVVHRDVVFRV